MENKDNDSRHSFKGDDKKTPACEFHLFLQGGIGGAKLGGGPDVNKDEQRS